MIQWTVHPARRHPGKIVWVLGVIFLLSMAVQRIYQSWMWAGFSGFVLLASLARFFFPTSYVMTLDYVQITFLGFRRRRYWSGIRRIVKTRGGVFLSPFERPNRLDHFRGLFILCGDNRSEVYEFAENQVPKSREKDIS